MSAELQKREREAFVREGWIQMEMQQDCENIGKCANESSCKKCMREPVRVVCMCACVCRVCEWVGGWVWTYIPLYRPACRCLLCVHKVVQSGAINEHRLPEKVLWQLLVCATQHVHYVGAAFVLEPGHCTQVPQIPFSILCLRHVWCVFVWGMFDVWGMFGATWTSTSTDCVLKGRIFLKHCFRSIGNKLEICKHDQSGSTLILIPPAVEKEHTKHT
jgi:hypothetical protein